MSRLRTTPLALVTYLALSGVLAPLCVAACSGEHSESTAGRRIHLAVSATGATDAGTAFTTGLGWTVTLSRAALAIDAVYCFDGPPPSVALPPRRWRGWLEPGVAHAHPGHYQPGTALAELVASANLDLLGAPVALGEASGITGTYRSARVVIAREPVGGATLGHAALAEGVAVKTVDGGAPLEVHFQISAEYADVARSAADGAIEGTTIDEVVVSDDGSLTLSVAPSHWFGLVDFSAVEPGTAAAPTPVAVGSVPQIAFAQGVTQRTAYHSVYQPEAQP